ncbi:unnamed protein product [Coregonus sp. 'balchen']|nr:unnamed protein product [Coregonus sp. 'balchen']
MTTMRIKSDQEIRELLDGYGIKHGPVVESTRHLYEKKLKEAMVKDKVTVTKPSPDRTFYREEREEVSYVNYRTPVRSEWPSGDGEPYMRSRPEYSDRDLVDEYVCPMSTTHSHPSSSYSKPTPVVKPGGGVVKAERKASSGRLIPLWIQFLVFLIVAGFLYFLFTSMESAESSPFNRIQ